MTTATFSTAKGTKIEITLVGEDVKISVNCVLSSAEVYLQSHPTFGPYLAFSTSKVLVSADDLPAVKAVFDIQQAKCNARHEAYRTSAAGREEAAMDRYCRSNSDL